jgi:hypothetical protein
MHITLTVPNIDEDEDEKAFIRHLVASFARLRTSLLWRSNVSGGAYGIEVTDKGNGLHPHIHILLDCRWLALRTPEPWRDDDNEQRKQKFECAAQELQSAWNRARRGSEHTSLWIRRCDSKAATEVVKYAVKGADLIACEGSAARICRMLDAVRLTSPFGNLRGLKMEPEERHRLTCPNGHSEWTPRPPVVAGEHRSAKEQLREQRAREFEEAYAKEAERWD